MHKTRNGNIRKSSGGIAIAVRDKLAPYIDHVPTDCVNSIWCKINPDFLCTSYPIFIVCVYIPPINSPYADKDCFYNLENEFLKYINISPNIFILGDWNSHINDKLEFFTMNESKDDSENEFLNESAAVNVLPQLNLPLRRTSLDKLRLDTWGKLFIEFCKNIGVIILNGRLGPLSCKNTTVFNTTVDYVLCSIDMLECVSYVNIHDFNPLLSDVHCAIETVIHITPNHTKQCELEQISMVCEHQLDIIKANRWENEKKDDYLLNLDKLLLEQIQMSANKFDEFKEKQQGIDNITSNISLLFLNAAFDTFGKKHVSKPNSKKSRPKKSNKPWYNLACRRKRVIFNKSRKKYNSTKSNIDFLLMRKRGKEYKYVVKDAYNQYTNEIRAQIRKLRKKSNIKEYWDYCKREVHDYSKTAIDFSSFVDFFRNLNSEHGASSLDPNTKIEPKNDDTPNTLDTDITASEIVKAVKKLKNNKACGTDEIYNEYIKSSIDMLLPVYVKLFNIIYENGIIPTTWTTGIIKPIYKQKGSREDPDNYRPITILSCLGKLYTSVLNNRLISYTEDKNIIGEEQIGFRENYSTMDGVFSLYSLIELMEKRKKKLFCAFIDLKKCFGSVWRDGLWTKLNLHVKLGRKMTNSILSIYKNVKSYLEMYSHDVSGQLIFNSSEMFNCLSGLREGENLSPILFSLYVNDLKKFLEECNCQGVYAKCLENDNIDEDIMYYIKIFILMYADDTVLFANTYQDLQHSLNKYNEYCKLWKLNVNVTKTKIMYFGRKGNYNFYLNNDQVEIVDSFKYLGVVFSRNGRFLNAINDNIEKARKGLLTLRRTFREKFIPIDCQIEMFEKVIEPILLYGCEIWGMENTEKIEQFRLRSFKQLLQLRNSTPAYIIYGELGKLPLKTTINTRMLKFWARIKTGKFEKISSQLLNLMTKDDCGYKWVNYIKNILDKTGNTYVWLNQHLDKKKENYIIQNLKDQELQNLNVKASTSSKGRTYMFLKTNWEIEYYLTRLDKEKTRALIRLRTGNHKFPIETGRYTNVPIENRTCRYCNRLGDEFHYVLECTQFRLSRNKYIDKKYYIRPNMQKFQELMNCKDLEQIKNLATFAMIIIKHTS